MQTVQHTSSTRKPTAYYATYHGLSGVLTRPAEAVLFLEPESGAVVTITPADEAALVVLGEVGDSMSQYLSDMARGGSAKVACARQMEVA
jgi:hypothetical protein